MMRKYSAIVLGLGLSALTALTFCGTRKESLVTTVDLRETSVSASSVTQHTNKRTLNFGDTLNASVFFQDEADQHTEDSAVVESKGVKTKIKIKPVFNAAGKKIGNKIDLSTIAKPVSVVNEDVARHEQKDSAAIKNKALHQEQKIIKKTSYSAIQWILMLCALIALILFRGWLYNLIFK